MNNDDRDKWPAPIWLMVWAWLIVLGAFAVVIWGMVIVGLIQEWGS